MHPPQPGRVPGARRADAGAVRLTGRDITGLIGCAEHYGAPTDLLAAALDVRADRLRAITARWRHAGYAATGTVGPGPAWCWLTPAGMAVTGLAYPASRLALSRLAHIRAVLAVRLWLQVLPVTEDGDQGGAGDADVGVKQSPAAGVANSQPKPTPGDRVDHRTVTRARNEGEQQ
jgi:hypothetical protein